MKSIYIVVIIILITWVNPMAKNLPLSTPHFSISSSILVDQSTQTLYIDLDEIDDKVILFNIQLDNHVIYIEDISEKNISEIVEYNFGKLHKGKYTLELVTEGNVKISKIFSIK